LITGLMNLAGFVVGLSDPAYYDPQTGLDYVASVLNFVGPLATGLALVVWWRVTPVRRAALLILGAGIGAVTWSFGNLLEEILRLDLGTDLYFFGATAAFGLSAAAGVVTLTAPTEWRWSGLFLLAVSAGIGFDSIPFWPVAWLGFAYVLRRGIFEKPGEAI
jgi:hypothetical protein